MFSNFDKILESKICNYTSLEHVHKYFIEYYAQRHSYLCVQN